jgi:hypothetical protein
MKKRRFALLPNHLDTQAIGIFKCLSKDANRDPKSVTPHNWNLLVSVAR